MAQPGGMDTSRVKPQNAEGYPNQTTRPETAHDVSYSAAPPATSPGQLGLFSPSLPRPLLPPRFFGGARSTSPLPTMAERIQSFDLGAKIRPSFSKLRRGVVSVLCRHPASLALMSIFQKGVRLRAASLADACTVLLLGVACCVVLGSPDGHRVFATSYSATCASCLCCARVEEHRLRVFIACEAR